MYTYLLSIYHWGVGGEYKLLFMVKLSLVEYYVYEIFDAYLVDNFYFIFISDVGLCKFLRRICFFLYVWHLLLLC